MNKYIPDWALEIYYGDDIIDSVNNCLGNTFLERLNDSDLLDCLISQLVGEYLENKKR